MMALPGALIGNRKLDYCVWIELIILLSAWNRFTPPCLQARSKLGWSSYLDIKGPRERPGCQRLADPWLS